MTTPHARTNPPWSGPACAADGYVYAAPEACRAVSFHFDRECRCFAGLIYVADELPREMVFLGRRFESGVAVSCAHVTEEAPAPIGHNAPLGRFCRCCLECGADFRSDKQWAEFCATDCRKDFNNRRQTRGAELYDLFMVMRYDRPAAKAFAVWKLLCRMAQAFRDEDAAQRAGRKSWRSPRAVIERHPDLQATVVARALNWKRPNVS